MTKKGLTAAFLTGWAVRVTVIVICVVVFDVPLMAGIVAAVILVGLDLLIPTSWVDRWFADKNRQLAADRKAALEALNAGQEAHEAERAERDQRAVMDPLGPRT